MPLRMRDRVAVAAMTPVRNDPIALPIELEVAIVPVVPLSVDLETAEDAVVDPAVTFTASFATAPADMMVPTTVRVDSFTRTPAAAMVEASRFAVARVCVEDAVVDPVVALSVPFVSVLAAVMLPASETAMTLMAASAPDGVMLAATRFAAAFARAPVVVVVPTSDRAIDRTTVDVAVIDPTVALLAFFARTPAAAMDPVSDRAMAFRDVREPAGVVEPAAALPVFFAREPAPVVDPARERGIDLAIEPAGVVVPAAR